MSRTRNSPNVSAAYIHRHTERLSQLPPEPREAGWTDAALDVLTEFREQRGPTVAQERDAYSLRQHLERISRNDRAYQATLGRRPRDGMPLHEYARRLAADPSYANQEMRGVGGQWLAMLIGEILDAHEEERRVLRRHIDADEPIADAEPAALGPSRGIRLQEE